MTDERTRLVRDIHEIISYKVTSGIIIRNELMLNVIAVRLGKREREVTDVINVLYQMNEAGVFSSIPLAFYRVGN
jgi:hypothetical protein